MLRSLLRNMHVCDFLRKSILLFLIQVVESSQWSWHAPCLMSGKHARSIRRGTVEDDSGKEVAGEWSGGDSPHEAAAPEG
jgi:hypothetical protein